MKNTMIGFVFATTGMLSGPASAHVGEHTNLGLLSGMTHLLTEHSYSLAIVAVVVGALLFKRARRV
jgi:hypothetical protein